MEYNSGSNRASNFNTREADLKLGILFICHTITIITKRCQKKKKNVGRDGEEA